MQTYPNAFERFQAAWPKTNRTGIHAAAQAWVSVDAEDDLAELFSGLERWKSSEQWADPKMIPRMDRWLYDRAWREWPAQLKISEVREFDPAPVKADDPECSECSGTGWRYEGRGVVRCGCRN